VWGRVSTGLRRKRMEQQAAFSWIARDDQLRNSLKVVARLLFRPRGTTRRQRLQLEARYQHGVTVIAADAVGTFFEEDGFDTRAIGRKSSESCDC
jgi:hypothetical protein